MLSQMSAWCSIRTTCSERYAKEQAMLLQEYLPTFHFSERHEAMVQASQDAVYDAALAVDFSQSAVIQSLLWLRQLPGRLASSESSAKGLGLSFDDFVEAGFIRLRYDPPREIVLGAAGKFWRASPQFLDLSPLDYVSFDKPGYIKLAFNILIEERSRTLCVLSTESRILCLDDQSRRRFRYYWALIRPFSGLIRHLMLRLIRKAAESS